LGNRHFSPQLALPFQVCDLSLQALDLFVSDDQTLNGGILKFSSPLDRIQVLTVPRDAVWLLNPSLILVPGPERCV
jgi:hypothetical protein